jgi:hypothetical protein
MNSGETVVLKNCSDVREKFSPYLDGDMSGTAMQSMAAHLDGCENCSAEFMDWREIQGTLAAMGPAKAPGGLQARLRAALAEECERGTHLAWHQRLAAMWHATLAPVAFRAATGTVAALVLIGGAGVLVAVIGAPSEVQANDEPLGAMTAPHFLYSEVPPQPIEFGREVPVLIEAKIDDQGRVYDYAILSGPTDLSVERRVQANLLASVFQPATVFGLPVAGHVVMTFTGVSVKG